MNENVFLADKTLLIADDSELMRDRISKTVEDSGFAEILTARDGREAASLCKSQQIDLVFLDISMPILDGIKALKIILSIRPQTHVVMISGSTTLENVKAALAAGAKGFVVKPIDENKIFEAINNYQKLAIT